MIAYWQPPDWSAFGHRLSFPILMVVGGILAMHALVLWQGRRDGLDSRHMAGAHLTMFLGCIAGGFTGHMWYQPGKFSLFLRDPAAAIAQGGFSSFGWIYTGFVWAFVYLMARRVPRDRWLPSMNTLALWFPVSWLPIRIGCALEHDHPGIQTDSWLGVVYPGGPRFDLGLLEAIFTLALLVLFGALSRSRQKPAYLALFLTSYGLFRLAIEPLAVAGPVYLGLSMNAWFALEGVAVGTLLALPAFRRRIPVHA